MNDTITLSDSVAQYAPVEGFFVAPTGEVTIELFSSDLSEAININLEGSLSNQRWGNIQEGGTDIVIPLTANTAVVRSFNVAKKASFRLKLPTGRGAVTYIIT